MCLFTAIDDGEGEYLLGSFSATFWVRFSNTLWGHLSLTPCLSGLELSSLGSLCQWYWNRECSQGSAGLWSCAERSPRFTGSPAASLSAALQPVWYHSVIALPCESCSAHQLWGCVKLWNNLTEIKQVQDLRLLCPQNQLLCDWGKLDWCGEIAYFDIDYCSSWLFLGANK